MQSRLFFDDLISPIDFPLISVIDTPANLGSGSESIKVLIDASVPGEYELPLVFTTLDEDIPGQSQDLLGVNLQLSIGSPVTGDFNGDGVVNFNDLLILLAAWGPCTGCPEDLNSNGDVDFSDLLVLLTLL